MNTSGNLLVTGLRRRNHWWPAAGGGLILAVGAALRLRAYSVDASLWADELAAAISLLHLPHDPRIADWVTNQPSPPGFQWMTRVAIATMGVSEKSLRLVPLVASLLSLPLFAWLAVQWGGLRAALLPLFVLSTNPSLVRYAAEFKTYSIDVSVTCVVLALAVAGGPSPRARRALLPVGAVAVWCSFPSIFVLASVGSLELYEAIRAGHRASQFAALRRGLVWLASFLGSFFLFARSPATNEWLLEYWREGHTFWPIFPPSLAPVSWPFERLTLLFVDPGGMAWGAIAGLAFFLLGVIALMNRHRGLWTLMVGPLALAMLASSVEKYPLYGRLMLFYCPMLALGLGEGARWAMSLSQRIWFRSAVALAMTAALVTPVATGVSLFLQPQAISDSRPVLEHVARQRELGDILYVFPYALPAVAFYGPGVGLGGMPVLSAPSPAHADSKNVAESLASIPRGTRVWFIMAGVTISRADYQRMKEENLSALSSRGRRLGEFHATEASVYLYEL